MSRDLVEGCFGKKAYPTKQEAKKRHPGQRVYWCPFGHGYHVSSKRSRRER